jgi:hypothetical protein
MTLEYNIGDGADALGQNQYEAALGGTYWVSGWDATLGTGDLEVDISSGEGAVDGTNVSTASTQTIDFTGDPDVTDPRKAVIYVDATGTVQKSLGTPQPVDPSGEIRFRTYNPSPPANVSGVVVAEVWLDAGETVLETADVRDRRVSNDAVEAVQPEPNVPNWQEDANSPLTIQNSTSGSITLNDSYDVVKLMITTAEEGLYLDMKINGLSTDYNLVRSDGTAESAVSEISKIEQVDALVGSEFIMSGKWAGLFGVSFDVGGATQDGVIKAWNSGATSPLTNIELLSGDPLTLTAKVYGLNE